MIRQADGATFDETLDGDRIRRQRERVLELMGDRQWRTLAEIHDATGDPEASISARLRDLRKPRFGAFTVERRRRADESPGLWEYRVMEPEPGAEPDEQGELFS